VIVAAPLVSVIVPTYNGSPYVTETLESVFRQTHPHREVIVVDDGSTDDTPDRVRKFGSDVTFIRQANGGVAAARNAGLAAASGDYIAFLDHDDVWLPEKLDVQLSVAARHPASGLIACEGVHFDGERTVASRLLYGPTADRLDSSPTGAVTVEHMYREMLRYNGLICTPSQTLIPRQVVERIGPQDVKSSLPDHDYQVRIAREYPVTLHRDRLVRWRYLASSMSGPLERRQFVWALGAVSVLKDEARRAKEDDRAFVHETLRNTVCDIADDAYEFGRRHDLSYARSYLAQLSRLVPGELRPLLRLGALYLPATFVEQGVTSVRTLRNVLRRAQ
jgi:glycosyltransferase involved in cell wall biosynthesis